MGVAYATYGRGSDSVNVSTHRFEIYSAVFRFEDLSADLSCSLVVSEHNR